MKRLLALLLCLVMALSLIPAAAAEDIEIIDIEEEPGEEPIVIIDPEAPAEPEPPAETEAEPPAEAAEPMAAVKDSGTIGNLTWTLYDDGLLEITGSGAIPHYPDSNPPFYQYRSEITSLRIGNGVTLIGQYAFRNMSALVSVSLPGSLTEVGPYAFQNCSALTSVDLPANLSVLGLKAFQNCSALTKVRFLGHAPNINSNCFYGVTATICYVNGDGSWTGTGVVGQQYGGTLTWTALTGGDCGDSLRWMLDGTLLLISGTGDMDEFGTGTAPWYDSRKNIQTVLIGDGVTSIGDYAFMNCSYLSDVTIPDGVTSIGSEAFYYCLALTDVTIPDGVTSIGNSAFSNCKSLTSVTIPDSVTSLEGFAFHFCTSLKDVSFGNGLTEIGDDAFCNCTALTGVTIPDSVTYIGDYAFYNCYSLTAVTIGNGVTSIGSSAFCNCTALTGVTIPDSVTYIGDYAFRNCTSLTGVTIPDSVTYIGDYAFYNCTSLASVTIGNGVTEIGKGAFLYCESLPAVTIPASVTEIGDFAFSCCSSLTGVTVAAGNPAYCSAGGVLFTKDKKLLLCYPAGKTGASYTVPAGVTGIGNYAFDTVPSLTSVTIPDGVTSIGNYAFTGCVSLTAVTIPDSVTSIGASAFINCTTLTDVYYPGTQAAWNAIGIGDGNEPLTGATIHYNYAAPAITAQPQSANVKAGASVYFQVEASCSAPLSYQWQFRTSASGAWKNSSGTGNKTPLLPITAETFRDGYQYRCLVTGGTTTVASEPATLTILSKPTITTQPASVTSLPDKTVTFTVAATGATSYQWQYRKSSSGTWANSSQTGAKTATLTVTATTARNGYQYRCKVTNSVGTETSNAATLTVMPKPTVTTQPKSVKAYVGKTASFTVAAEDAANYQWYYRTSSTGSWAKSSATGATTATLKITAETKRNGYQYRCRISNAMGYVYTSAATLTVSTKPVITTQPKSKTAASGTTVKFTVAADGATSYQWYYRTSSTGEWKKCSGTGATTKTLSVEAKSFRSGYQYRCRVSNDAGYVYSSAATLTVSASSAAPGMWD
ncbi:MAG: leucine-rich repeat protein [Oscillospiraceae bacterium]|nr:leucine-rich repeat protein [Oscillospiraceae bacterium]